MVYGVEGHGIAARGWGLQIELMKDKKASPWRGELKGETLFTRVDFALPGQSRFTTPGGFPTKRDSTSVWPWWERTAPDAC
jgi:hypothetical protein